MKNDYSFLKYVYFSRWVSYWHQIDEVLKLRPESVLLVGAGDKIVSRVISEYVSKVITLDVDESVSPDIIASVEKMPLEDGSYDVILCAEVLEHLSFDKFEVCLNEINRVAGKHVVLSLPHFGPAVKINFKLPLLPEFKIAAKIPFPMTHRFNGKHYWEIGKKGYSLKKIKRMIKQYFKIENDFIPFENQYHHFFVLDKIREHGTT